ncbi:hypothetical protein VTN31DRAFT_840 [Thermomyces dupontii]|uniref:uncharacterized protein n=1 Tax=Talaromyces thermophilus TaxID=28565 RepID=UPI00374266FE
MQYASGGSWKWTCSSVAPLTIRKTWKHGIVLPRDVQDYASGLRRVIFKQELDQLHPSRSQLGFPGFPKSHNTRHDCFVIDTIAAWMLLSS